MKACIIVQNLPVPMDRRVWLEATSLRDAGHDVAVICPKAPGDPRHECIAGVEVYKYVPLPAANGVIGYVWEFLYCFVRTAWLLRIVHRRHGIDVLQTCNPPDTYWALARPLKRWYGTKFVFDQHDLCPETYRSRFETPSPVLDAGLRWLERSTYRTADHVISTNESYRRVALDRGAKAPDEVTVVRTGPDPDRLRRGEPHDELRRGREHLLVYVGVMGPQDGVDLAVRAVDHLVHELGRTDVSVALLGGGDCHDDLRALVASLGLDDVISMPGHVPDDVLFAHLSTGDIGLSPDPSNPLNDVSTMNKTMEYLAFGLPVVAFDLPETEVSAGEAAVYVGDNDVAAYARAIDALLDDPAARARMGRLGRRRVEDVLAWRYQADAYVGVFEQLTGGAVSPLPRRDTDLEHVA